MAKERATESGRAVNGRLLCFSPPVMIATVVIELGLAAYVVWRYKLNAVRRPAVLILLLLAVFQLAEYFVCRGAAANVVPWARLGFSAIALLPPLGLTLIFALAGARQKWPLWLAYTMAAGFIGIFWLYEGTFSGGACLGNYVIFELSHNVGGWFGWYYYVWLGVGLYAIWHFLGKIKRRRDRLALDAMALGYALFIVPTGIVNTLSPQTLRGIPSIMCGFAVLLAFTIAFVVMPATVANDKSDKSGK